MPGLTIRELPSPQRPREKLLARGTQGLSDAELIAILLRTGVPGSNAVQVADALIRRFGSLSELAKASVPSLATTHGVGPAKAIQLAAAFVLGARLASEKFAGQPLDRPDAIYELVAPEFQLFDREVLQVLLLDTRLRLIARQEVSRGTLNESLAHPREIFKSAIAHSAYAVILVHNHPSGDCSPSDADHRLTKRVAEAGRLLQIALMDHLIIGQPMQGRLGYFSFRESGIIG